MAVTITRSIWIDDDGTGTTGTVINQALHTTLYNEIDTALAKVAQLAGGNSFTGKQTFTVAPMVPASGGTAVFAVDCTDSPFLVLADSTTATPFGNTNALGGLFVVEDLLVSGATGLFLAGGTIALVAQSAGSPFTTAAGTAGKFNVYHTAGVITLENKLGAQTSVRVMALRLRTGM